MSPNTEPKTAEKPRGYLLDKLKSDYKSTALAADSPVEIPFKNESEAMACYIDDDEGVKQMLMGVVSAGVTGELFSIVKVTSYKGSEDGSRTAVEDIAVTHHANGKSAELIGTIPEGPGFLVVGRSPQKELGYRSDVSRNHFTVSMLREPETDEYSLDVTDNGSTYGTELFTSKHAFDLDDSGAEGPVEDPLFWSVDINDIKKNDKTVSD